MQVAQRGDGRRQELCDRQFRVGDADGAREVASSLARLVEQGVGLPFHGLGERQQVLFAGAETIAPLMPMKQRGPSAPSRSPSLGRAPRLSDSYCGIRGSSPSVVEVGACAAG